LHAQQVGISFHHIGIESGLSQSTVLSSLQDSRGFMWFGTFDGLNKYNGKDFTIYYPDENNDKTISSGTIYSMCEGKDGLIYIATSGGGLNVYNPDTEKFTFYFADSSKNSVVSNSLYYVISASDSTIWIATYDGVSHYYPKTHTFKNYPFGEKRSYGYPKHTALSLYEDDNHIIWIGTYGGLYQYKFDVDGFIPFDNKASGDNNFNANVIVQITKGFKNNLLLATNHGAYSFNLTTHQFKSFYPGNYKISSILVDSKNTIWVGTAENGLIRMESQGENPEIKQIQSNNSTLPDNNIRSIYEDYDHNVWIGLSGFGLAYLNLNHKPFYHIYSSPNENSLPGNSIFGIAEDNFKNVWIGTLSGLSYWDRKKNTFINFTVESKINHIIDNRVWETYFDKQDNTLWIGTSNGLSNYNPQTKETQNYYHNPKDSTSVSSNEIFCINSDKMNRIWVGTYNGLNRFDNKHHTFVDYYKSDSSNSLTSNVINYILSDREGRLWICTEDGLNQYNFEKNDFVAYFSSRDKKGGSSLEVLYLTEDSEGNLWLSTHKGLLKFNPQTGEHQLFGLSDGLPNLSLYGSIEHGDDIWFTSNQGLSRINKKSYRIINYDITDGLQSNEFNIATRKLSDGLMMFGGINGITTFYADSIKETALVPPLYFTKLYLNGQKINIGEELNGYIPLKETINKVKRIELSYKEKLINIEFVALDYSAPEKINYAYRLIPISPDWVSLGKKNNVNFTNLRNGKYRLEIRSTNTDQTWVENVNVLDIIIHPPIYETVWAYLLEIVLLALGIVWFVRNRVNRIESEKIKLEQIVKERTEEIQAQKEEIEAQRNLASEQRDKITEQKAELEHFNEALEEKVRIRTKELVEAKLKAEESDRLKSAFLSNMSHEIRTPLNAIIGFSDLLLFPDIDFNEKRHFIELIKTNGSTLLNLLNDIIDISIIESGQLQVRRKKIDLVNLTDEIYTSFLSDKQLMGKKELKFRLSGPSEKSIEVETDPFRLTQILNNLIDNAIKYTTQGEIALSYKKEGTMILFTVRDTGIGIHPDAKNFIFERFYKMQDGDKNPYRGGGLGLAISRSLVEALGGQIWVDSELGKGSTFYFTISG